MKIEPKLERTLRYEFNLEPWEKYYSDPARERLWREHDQLKPEREGNLLVAPDLSFFESMEKTGRLKIIVARESEGEALMVGYCLVFLSRHSHYSALFAYENTSWVDSRHRNEGIGKGLVETACTVAKRFGAQRVFFSDKGFSWIGAMLGRQGFSPDVTVYAKWLNAEPEEN